MLPTSAAHKDQTLQDISLNANPVDNVLLSHEQHMFIPAANSANQSLPDPGTMSPVQSPLNREIESIRTLPGLIPLTRMVRATKEYGRCHVCTLQGIAWWDQETKTGICQTCYEREILIHKESVT